MAKFQTPDPTPEPTSTVDIQAIADAIAKGIVQAGNETGPIKQIPITKYRNKTVYNPEGLYPHKRPQFTRDYYQNGKHIVADVLTPADISALERLTAGRYLNRLVEVIERESEGSEMRSLEVRYPSATHDQRIAAGKVFTTFSQLLQLLLAEQERLVKAS